MKDRTLFKSDSFHKIILLLICLALTGFKVYAQGTAFTYQGWLNSSSSPANGAYDIRFALFPTNANGVSLAGPVTNFAVKLTNGCFTTVVDFGDAFATGSNWLEIAIATNGSSSFATLAPRQLVTPVPFAVTAANISGLVQASQIYGTLANNNLPANPVFSGTVTATALAGNGSGLTNLSATQIVGTLAVGVLPGNLVITNPYELSALTNSLRSAAAPSYQYGWPDYSQWPDGWNSWFAAGESVSEALIVNALAILKTNGLAACGFTTISIDEGLFTNRDTSGIPQMDLTKWPHGFPWLCNFIITNGFKVGIYSVFTNGVGLAQDNFNNYIFGAEDVQANYFLTNGVTYYKVDSPINSGLNYPNEVDFLGNIVVPMENAWDNSYLRFVTDLRNANHPVFVNASFFVNTNGQFSPNVRQLLNSYRLTQTSFANKVGMRIGGDITGGNAPLMDWNWAYLNATFMEPYIGGYFYPDFDSQWGSLLPDAQRKFYTDAMFGSIFQFGGTIQPHFGSVYTGWYHNITNELGNPLIKQIRARQTPVRFFYQTNGCLVYGKDNRNGGLDILVLNENYAVTVGGDGATVEIPQDYSPFGNGVIQFTNNFSYGGTNYQNVFSATNVVLDFARLGMWSPNCIVTTVDNGGANVYATGSFAELVFAAGARLYTVTPVTSFPAAQTSYRDLTAERYFLFWTTNKWGQEPIYNAFNALPPVFGTQSVAGLQLGDDLSSFVSWGINGASSFTALTGVNGYGNAYGGQMTFLIDGIPVYTNPVIYPGYTNVTITFSPTNQIFTICSSNRNYLGNPRMNYGQFALSATGNGSELTGLATSQLVDFSTASNDIAASAATTASNMVANAINGMSKYALTNQPLQNFNSATIAGGNAVGFLGTSSSGALVVTTNVSTGQVTGTLALPQLPAAVVTNNSPNYLTNYMIAGNGGSPIITTLSPNVSGVQITGNDSRFKLSFNLISGLPAGSTNLIWISYSQTNSVTAPMPVFSPASPNAVSIGGGYSGWFTTSESTNGFALALHTPVALAALTNCVLNFTVGR